MAVFSIMHLIYADLFIQNSENSKQDKKHSKAKLLDELMRTLCGDNNALIIVKMRHFSNDQLAIASIYG